MAQQLSPTRTAASGWHERKPIRSSLVWWLRFFGVAAFFALLLRLPTFRSQAQLIYLNLGWLGFCMLLTILQSLLDAWVWQWLLWAQRIRHSYPKTLVASLASQYLGLVTPGHVGEFLAAGYISMETGITFGYALSSVVMRKCLAWVSVIGFGVWGLPLLAQIPLLQGVQRLIWLSLTALTVLAAAITVWVVSLRRLARKWQKLSPWQIDMTEFWAGMRQLWSFRLIGPLMVTAATFGLLFVQVHAVLHALGISLPLIMVAKIIALSRILARLMPISLVGFGSKDAALIWLLAQQGIDPSVGLTAALLFLICSYLVTLLLSGLCWWVKPLVVRRVAARVS